jgi:adenylylsulfate reductase subunit A
MWYSPFNTGAGYAIGIRAGAEMTSFEHRFIALRTKDTIAPTGTLALGFGAPQVNSKGEEFMKLRWADKGGEGAPTPLRLEAPLQEIAAGNGPCFMDTRHLSPADLKRLYEAYLDMYPNTVLYWAANNVDLTRTPVEICGTEPYLVGGHCQAGYWVDVNRRTTLPNLFAAGDVAGGAPYKFVSGCFAEGAIAARAASREIQDEKRPLLSPTQHQEEELLKRTLSFLAKGKTAEAGSIRPEEAESRLQKVMDEYAGGLRTSYRMNEAGLRMAQEKLAFLRRDLGRVQSTDSFSLMGAHEVADRLDVAQVLVEHLLARRETRWPGFQSRQDCPTTDRRYEHFINSVREKDGTIRVILRSLHGEILPWDDDVTPESLREETLSGTTKSASRL